MGLKTRLAASAAAAALAIAGALAAKFEGSRSVPYKDPVQILTVCEGHTGADIVPGKVYSPAECAEFKRKDLAAAEAVVDRCITGELTIGQRAALIDFAFNVGPGRKGVKDGLCTLKSGAVPTITRLFNAGKGMQACAEFPKWNAQRLPGLTKRRAAEDATCRS
jgi:lysozyme